MNSETHKNIMKEIADISRMISLDKPVAGKSNYCTMVFLVSLAVILALAIMTLNYYKPPFVYTDDGEVSWAMIIGYSLLIAAVSAGIITGTTYLIRKKY